MNQLEKYIHSRIGHYPSLRIPLVALYQRICSIIPSKDYEHSPVLYRRGYFFGFHDKCPWSADSTKVLSHCFNINKPIDQIERSPLKVGYFKDSSLSHFQKIGITNTWNWQQGASLQWVGQSEQIVFNDIIDGKEVAKIVDLEGRIIRILPVHIVDVSSNGRYALSYNFQRLGIGMNGYGYNHKDIVNASGLDGSLWLINLSDGSISELISLADISRLENAQPPKGSHQFFYYCHFSPNSERFTFLYCLLLPSGELIKHLYSMHIGGSDLYRIPGEDFSHMTWKDDNNILAFLKPLGGETGFYLIQDRKGLTNRVGRRMLISDGHPQFSTDKKHILVDTYPDRLRNQYLKLFNLESESQTILLKKRVPFHYRYERRCDFHPRFNRDSTLICFDGIHNNVRSLCIVRGA